MSDTIVTREISPVIPAFMDLKVGTADVSEVASCRMIEFRSLPW